MGAEQSRPIHKYPKDDQIHRIKSTDSAFHDSVEVIKIRRTTSDTHDDSTTAAPSLGIVRPNSCFGGWVVDRFTSEHQSNNVLTKDTTFTQRPDLDAILSTSIQSQDLVSPIQDQFSEQDSNLASVFRTRSNDLELPSLDAPPRLMQQARSRVQLQPKIYNHETQDKTHPFFRNDDMVSPTPKVCGIDFDAFSSWGMTMDVFGKECGAGLFVPFFNQDPVQDDDDHEDDLLLNVESPRSARPLPMSSTKERLLDQATHLEAQGQLLSAQTCLERCIQLFDGLEDENLPEQAEVFHKLGVIQWKSGSYSESLTNLHRALELYEMAFECFPTDDVWAVGNVIDKSELFADILNNIGTVNQSIGDYAQASKCFRRSFEMLASVLPAGDDSGNVYHPSFARAIIGIGNVYDAKGKSARAMQQYTNGLIVQRACLGSNHVDIAATLNSIGGIVVKEGKYNRALDCYNEALRIYKSQSGYKSFHVDTAVTMNNIGFIYYLRGDYEVAMSTYSSALKIMEDVLSSEHRNVASTLYSMGLVHAKRGQFESALQVFRKVLSIQRSALGDLHADVAITLDSIADAYEKLDCLEKACKSCLRSLSIRRKTLGRHHFHVGLSLLRLGKIYQKMGEDDLANKCFEGARNGHN